MKILQYVTDLWTMNITFYKEKLNPLSSLMTGATYWCKKQTAIVLVSDRQRNAASQKLSKPMILARYFIHVWIGVLRAWRFIGTCQREKIQFDVEDFSSQRHASVLQCTMWQRQRCMWSVLAAHFLAVDLALHFVSMSFFCKNQYSPNSIWQLLYGCQQKIISELWVVNLFCTIQFE